VTGYEAEKPGDGLFGYYYDNEVFSGGFVKRVESQINFSLKSESPMEGINFENYSVKFVGFLRIPITGKYTFIAKSDDGHQLKING